MGDNYVKKTRVLVAKKRYESIIGREWLSTLRYTFAQEKGELVVNSIEKDGNKALQFENELPKWFTEIEN